MWNLNREQGDWDANTIKDILTMLYETVLNDVDGASHIKLSGAGFTATDVASALQELMSDDSALNTLITNLTTALATHKESDDHDERYFTEAELTNGVLDGRYFTETELNNGVLDNRYFTETELTNGVLDTRYVTNGQVILDNMNIVGEVFTVTNADNGDNTFTYTDKDANVIIGTKTATGQIFTLQLSDYSLGVNHIKAWVNDTLQRSAISGGLVEIDSTHVEVATVTTGAEITFEYYTRLNNFGAGIYYGATEPVDKYPGKIWIQP